MVPGSWFDLVGVLALPGRDLVHPGGALRRVVALGQGLVGRADRGERRGRLAGDADVRRPVLRDLGRVDVDVDDAGVGRPLAHDGQQDPLVEAHAHGQDGVGRLEGVGGRGDAVHAGHAHEQGVGARKAAEAHQGGVDRDAGDLGQAGQLGRGLAGDDPAAGVDDRTLGRRERARRRLHLARVARAGGGPVAGHGRLGVVEVLDLAGPLVHADVDQHRAGAPRLGHVEGLGERPRQVVGVLDQVRVLHDRQGDADDVRLLEGVGAHARGADLAGDRDQRHRVHVGVGDRGHEVGRARPRGGRADAGPSGDLRVPFGHVAGTLLVAHQEGSDVRVVVERVEERDHRSSRQPEDGVHARPLEASEGRIDRAHAWCPSARWLRRLLRRV